VDSPPSRCDNSGVRDLVESAISTVASHPSVMSVELAGSRSRGTHEDLSDWDWTWWLATKASVGRDDVVEQHCPKLYRHLLEPMGADTAPDSIEAAVRGFLVRRGELERQYGLEVPRALEGEVRRGIRRIGFYV
jgi:hypothetical protein